MYHVYICILIDLIMCMHYTYTHLHKDVLPNACVNNLYICKQVEKPVLWYVCMHVFFA